MAKTRKRRRLNLKEAVAKVMSSTTIQAWSVTSWAVQPTTMTMETTVMSRDSKRRARANTISCDLIVSFVTPLHYPNNSFYAWSN